MENELMPKPRRIPTEAIVAKTPYSGLPALIETLRKSLAPATTEQAAAICAILVDRLPNKGRINSPELFMREFIQRAQKYPADVLEASLGRLSVLPGDARPSIAQFREEWDLLVGPRAAALEFARTKYSEFEEYRNGRAERGS
jgi:hypothetical protein